jgi:hypothetical protein
MELYIFFLSLFCKIYDLPEILQNYTSAVVAHGVRVLPPRGTAACVVAHWQGHIQPWPTALGP